MNKKRSSKTSLIVSGIFLLIALLIVIFQLIPFNMQNAINDYMEAMQNSDINSNELGELIIMVTLIGGIGLLALMCYGYFLIIISFVPSLIILLKSVENVHDENKVHRVINWIYVGISGGIILTCIIKLVLFICKLG